MDYGHNAVDPSLHAAGEGEPKPIDDRIVVKSALATMGTPEYLTRFDAVAPSKSRGGK